MSACCDPYGNLYVVQQNVKFRPGMFAVMIELLT